MVGGHVGKLRSQRIGATQGLLRVCRHRDEQRRRQRPAVRRAQRPRRPARAGRQKHDADVPGPVGRHRDLPQVAPAVDPAHARHAAPGHLERAVAHVGVGVRDVVAQAQAKGERGRAVMVCAQFLELRRERTDRSLHCRDLDRHRLRQLPSVLCADGSRDVARALGLKLDGDVLVRGGSHGDGPQVVTIVDRGHLRDARSRDGKGVVPQVFRGRRHSLAEGDLERELGPVMRFGHTLELACERGLRRTGTEAPHAGIFLCGRSCSAPTRRDCTDRSGSPVSPSSA